MVTTALEKPTSSSRKDFVVLLRLMRGYSVIPSYADGQFQDLAARASAEGSAYFDIHVLDVGNPVLAVVDVANVNRRNLEVTSGAPEYTIDKVHQGGDTVLSIRVIPVGSDLFRLVT